MTLTNTFFPHKDKERVKFEEGAFKFSLYSGVIHYKLLGLIFALWLKQYNNCEIFKYLPGKLIIWDTLISYFFLCDANKLVSEDTPNYESEANFKLNIWVGEKSQCFACLFKLCDILF